MNYQTFGNLQFRPLLENSFHRILIELRDTSSEEIPFVSVGITRLVLMFRKASNIQFHSIDVLVGNVGGASVHLHKLLGELQFQFCVNISSQLQNA